MIEMGEEKIDVIAEAAPGLRRSDMMILRHWLSPAFVVPLAEHYGEGDPVAGARRAYVEVRQLIMGYARYAGSRRGGSWREVVEALRALGWRGCFSRVDPAPGLDTPWRRAAEAIFDDAGCAIPGWVRVRVGDASRDRIGLATIRCASKMLRDVPRLNVARLRGRLYQRRTAEVMVTVSTGAEAVSSYTIDAAELDDDDLKAKIHHRMRDLVKARRHRLNWVSFELLAEWAREGFIASAAGCVVSAVGGVGISSGFSALVPGNGIPLAICVGEAEDGWVTLALTPDHRAFDATHGGMAYGYLKKSIEGELQS